MKCGNCLIEGPVCTHHIIPRIKGGTDNPGNLAILCYSCHEKVHEHSSVNVSLLTKEGLKRAIANGAKVGAPKGSKNKLGKFKEYDSEFIEEIRLLSIKHTCQEISDKMGISVSSVSRLQRKFGLKKNPGE